MLKYSVIHWLDDGEFVGPCHGSNSQQELLDYVCDVTIRCGGKPHRMRIVDSMVGDAMKCAQLIDEGCFTYDAFLHVDKKHEFTDCCRNMAKYYGVPESEYKEEVDKWLGGKYNLEPVKKAN